MTRHAWRVASLLFFSGLCALVYQTVWLRQFRLIFGASTFATGAVLAIFMAGLGAGSALLGKRADARERPLLFYGNLELLISIAAAISPLLLEVAARIYFASGGSPQLGIAGATLLRLVLAILVLGPATLLMGGTLPAAARAVATTADSGRHAVALLYGVNTLGAVAGALLSTFVLLETLGNRMTLIVAVLVNVLVAVVARSIGRNESTSEPVVETTESLDDSTTRRPDLPAMPVYLASAIVGFAFLLMELVWYRMLSPILGGTTYMFGLILAMALLGIGVGGGLYAAVRSARVTAGAFALTCSLEALAIAVPFALGDRLAVLANAFRGLGALGFAGHVSGWAIITFIVVFPAACVAGYQFPLLIALLGRGSENVGRQIGAAYAWNTAGAIAGSLAGGFGILPLLSAPGTWRLVALLLLALAAAAVFIAFRESDLHRAFVTVVVGIIALSCAFATGPTAVWRHSGIGAARAPIHKSRNEFRAWVNSARRPVLWERDGRESSIAAITTTDIAFYVNGKSDGASRGDAETQVMIGLLGAILHPRPTSSLVIGLGTGSTSGWLGQIPSMQRVDTIELEPVVLDIARACAPVNANALANPKVHVTIADAREVLLASDRTYDLIASEPSNPYRAGVASLFTKEFYEAADRRLARGGHLMQWVQAYAVHASTMKTIYATLTSVFPNVQTWWTSRGDLLLIASRDPIVMDANTLRSRMAAEPYRTALHAVWRADTLEQLLGRVVANETYSKAASRDAADLNTDDRPVIEFGFAKSIDTAATLMSQIANEAERMRLDRPVAFRGAVDWKLVDANRLQNIANSRQPMNSGALSQWIAARIETGDLAVQPQIDLIRTREPIEADILTAALLVKQQQYDEAARVIHRAFIGMRTYPWADEQITAEGMRIARVIGESAPPRAKIVHDALSQPFAVRQQEELRRYSLVSLAPLFDGCGRATMTALQSIEPHVFWNRAVLDLRVDCYRRNGLDALADRAWRDLDEFIGASQTPVVTPPDPPALRGSF